MSEKLAYAAGIMDGEGTIVIVVRNRGKYNWYQDSISVHMGTGEVVDYLYNNFGGNRYVRKEVGKTTYIWQMWCKQAREFLKKVMPYLITKKRQAEVFLEMGEIKEASKRFQKDPEYIQNKKLELYYELRNLHQRSYLYRQKLTVATG